MAEVTITLPDAAVEHARACAVLVGQDSLEAWITEWLINTVKQVERTKRQQSITKLDTAISADVDALYADGTVGKNLLLVPKP